MGWHSLCSDLLRAGRSRDRIPVGTRVSAPVKTSPGAHPASYTMGTVSFLGVKWPGRGIDHPPPSSTKVKDTSTPPLGLCGLFLGEIYYLFIFLFFNVHFCISSWE